MSWTDEELSEMAKAAHAEQTFVYDDSFWKEASALLPQKKRRFLPFLFLALIPLAGVMAYFAIPQKQVSQGEYVAKSMDLQSNEKAQVNFAAVQSTSNNSDENLSANVISADGKEKSTPTSWNNGSSSNFLGANNRSTRVKMSSPSIGLPGAEEGKAQTLIAVNEPSNDSFNSTEIPTPAVDDELTIENSAPQNEVSRPQLKGLELNKLENIGFLPPLALSFNYSNAQPPFPSLYTRKPRNYWNIYAQAGYGMGQSYVFNQVGHTNSFNLGAGARYNFKGYFLQMGLAGELQKVKLEVSERAKIYHTSSTILENLFSYRQLYRIEMPVSFGYELKNHVFQANLAPAYLLSSKMDYKYLVDGSAMRDETIYGDKTGWKDFSFGVGLGYGYKIFKTVTIGADLKWQLVNQLDKNIVSEGNVRPFSGQVFLRKTF